MIGGTMLLCAVAAMVLLATWSIARDDDPDAHPRDGLLALRSLAPRKKSGQADTTRGRSRKPAEQRRTARKPRTLRFDPDEMAEIAEEAEATLPRFVRDAREEY